MFALLALPFWLRNQGNVIVVIQGNFGSFHNVLSSDIFLAYWTFCARMTSQSIGKRVLKIKSIRPLVNAIDIKNAALESFGRSFLLPIDVILGWLFTNNK